MLIGNVIGLLAALYLAVGIGANDETLAPLAGSGALSLDSAVIIGAIAASLGAVFLGSRVEDTIGNELLTRSLIQSDIILVLVAVAVFLTAASSRGLPVSTTHSTVGAVVGIGLAKWGLQGVSWSIVFRISIGWLLSPLIGFAGSYTLNKYGRRLQSRLVKGLENDLRLSRWSAIFLFFWVILTEFSRGANDLANVTAFLVPMGIAEPLVVRLVTGAGLAIGLMVIGRKVVQTVGGSLVKMEPLSGLAAQIVVSLTLLIGTLLGLPLSGTHILVGAIIGIGVSENRYIDYDNIREIVTAWLGTFIGTFSLSYASYWILVFTGML